MALQNAWEQMMELWEHFGRVSSLTAELGRRSCPEVARSVACLLPCPLLRPLLCPLLCPLLRPLPRPLLRPLPRSLLRPLPRCEVEMVCGSSIESGDSRPDFSESEDGGSVSSWPKCSSVNVPDLDGGLSSSASSSPELLSSLLTSSQCNRLCVCT